MTNFNNKKATFIKVQGIVHVGRNSATGRRHTLGSTISQQIKEYKYCRFTKSGQVTAASVAVPTADGRGIADSTELGRNQSAPEEGAGRGKKEEERERERDLSKHEDSMHGEEMQNKLLFGWEFFTTFITPSGWVLSFCERCVLRLLQRNDCHTVLCRFQAPPSA